jgi:predicted metal-dependent hydrolase
VANEARSRNLPLFSEAELEARLPVVREGIAQYNDGYFFEAHETWEDVWLQCPVPARTFLQGMIQVAAAFVHLMRREYPGTVRLLGHAIEKLEGFPDGYLGVDAARLAAEARRARDELLELGQERFASWDTSRIPKIRTVTLS